MWPSIPQITIVLILIVLVVVPPVLVLASSRSQGGEKLGWFLATLLFSWLGYVAFMIATKQNKNSQKR